MIKNNYSRLFDFIGIILLIIAILGASYSFYSLMRLYCTILFGTKAVRYYTTNEKIFFIFLFSALLVQPFIKLPIGRSLWIFIDIIWIFLLIIELKKIRELI